MIITLSISIVINMISNVEVINVHIAQCLLHTCQCLFPFAVAVAIRLGQVGLHVEALNTERHAFAGWNFRDR